MTGGRGAKSRGGSAGERRAPSRAARGKQTTPGERRAPARRGIAVMIVDDHPMWRATLHKVLTEARVGTVVAEAADGAQVVELARDAKPDVVVMDLGLPSLDGTEATRRLLAALPGSKVLVLSASDAKADVVAAVDAGAAGYLLKTAEPDDVVDAVRRVSRGEMVFPPELAGVVLGELRGRSAATVHRVAVADPSMLSREGIARVLAGAGFEVTGIAADTDALIELITDDPPEVVILDLRLAEQLHDGVPFARALRRAHPGTGVLVLSQAPDASAVELLADGTKGLGYLLRDRVTDVAELGEMIRRVARGGSAVDPEVVAGLLASDRDRQTLDKLTRREREVLGMMAEGRSNQAICERLYLTPKTVETHVRSIFMKLGLEPTADDHRRVMAVLAYLRSL